MNGKSDYWVCNVSRENLPRIKQLIFTSEVWKNRKINPRGWFGTNEKGRLYIHGRNPNRKQFRDQYRGCTSGTQSAIRVEHAVYFGVYVNDTQLVPQLRQLILEKQ